MRPYLAFSIDIVSRFMERPKVSHVVAVKRILHYVRGSFGCGILFPAADTGRKCNLLSFTNSNWCGDKYYRKSTTGYIFTCVTPISWCSKKEPIVALSSCEAKYIVASLCGCQAVWLMNIIEELGRNEGETVTLFVDNVSAINLTKNAISHGRSKHIEIRFHYLREVVGERRFRLGYCRSEDQVVDLLIKGVTNDVFKRLKMSMGMIDLQHLK